MTALPNPDRWNVAPSVPVWAARFPEAAAELRALLLAHVESRNDDIEALWAFEALADDMEVPDV